VRIGVTDNFGQRVVAEAAWHGEGLTDPVTKER
jgi:hypothetical protein